MFFFRLISYVMLVYVQLYAEVDGNKDAIARFTYHRPDTEANLWRFRRHQSFTSSKFHRHYAADAAAFSLVQWYVILQWTEEHINS